MFLNFIDLWECVCLYMRAGDRDLFFIIMWRLFREKEREERERKVCVCVFEGQGILFFIITWNWKKKQKHKTKTKQQIWYHSHIIIKVISFFNLPTAMSIWRLNLCLFPIPNEQKKKKKKKKKREGGGDQPGLS